MYRELLKLIMSHLKTMLCCFVMFFTTKDCKQLRLQSMLVLKTLKNYYVRNENIDLQASEEDGVNSCF